MPLTRSTGRYETVRSAPVLAAAHAEKHGVIVQHLHAQRTGGHRVGYRRPQMDGRLETCIEPAAAQYSGEQRIAGPGDDLSSLRIVLRLGNGTLNHGTPVCRLLRIHPAVGDADLPRC